MTERTNFRKTNLRKANRDRSRSPFRSRSRVSRRRTAGRPLLVITGLFVAGTAVTWLAVTHLAYATGMAGTSGHLSVQACSYSETGGHRYPHCHGIFRSDDGTVVDTDATVDSDLPVGSTVALRRTSSDGYEQIGVAAAFGWLALSLSGLLVLTLGATAVRARTGPETGSRRRRVLLGVLVTATLTSAFIGGMVGLLQGL